MAKLKRSKTKFRGVYAISGERGAYVLRVTATEPTSKKVRERERVVRGMSLIEAEQARIELIQQLRAEIEAGEQAVDALSLATYAEYVEQYLAESEAKGLRKAGSVSRDRDVFRTMILPILGSFKLGEIGRKHLQHWQEEVQKLRKANGKLYALNSYKKAWRILRASLKHAHRESIIPSDPTYNLRMSFSDGIEAKQKVALTAEECARLVDTLKNEEIQLQAMVLFGMVYGCRFGELSALSWDSVCFEKGEITISRSFSNGVLEQGTKNGRNNVLPVLPAIERVLEQLQAEQDGKHNPENLVFPSKRTRSFCRVGWFNQQLGRICKRAKIRSITAHDLRRTANTMLFRSGVAPEVIRKTLNHKSAIMSEHYLVLNAEQTGSVLSGVWADTLEAL